MTVTRFSLLSHTPVTHCISHAEKLLIIYLIYAISLAAPLSRENQARLAWSSAVDPATHQPIKKREVLLNSQSEKGTIVSG